MSNGTRLQLRYREIGTCKVYFLGRGWGEEQIELSLFWQQISFWRLQVRRCFKTLPSLTTSNHQFTFFLTSNNGQDFPINEAFAFPALSMLWACPNSSYLQYQLVFLQLENHSLGLDVCLSELEALTCYFICQHRDRLDCIDASGYQAGSGGLLSVRMSLERLLG